MSASKVVMYSTAWCGYCARARRLLISKGIAFEEIDIDTVAGAYEQMAARSAARTVPQIFIGDTHVGGCDDLYALDAAGRLEKLWQTGVIDEQ